MEVPAMNETGTNIVKAVREFRELYKQIGLLLQTADDPMGKQDWEPLTSQAVSGSSMVDRTVEWLRSYAFRVYTNAEIVNRLAFISVILDDPHAKAAERVTEALLSAGWYEYDREPRGLDTRWMYRHIRFANWPDNGQFTVTTDKKQLGYDRHKVKRFCSNGRWAMKLTIELLAGMCAIFAIAAVLGTWSAQIWLRLLFP
jgi:hypothetical protein